ncbi:CHASE4 domain-containing protein [Herpetosiphon sp. NSE202]|uniref:CHASE4 domain-containing protein n=1 Tax=Herpetosiphon sp. NSE202 TaxID=3351349 RepID=UPI00362A2557
MASTPFTGTRSLRRQTTIVLVTSLVLLVIVLIFPLRILLLQSFAELETSSMQTDLDRVANALQAEQNRLDTALVSWSTWDDTYAFIEAPAADYISNNVGDDVFASYKLNLMAFLNQQQALIYGRMADAGRFDDLPTEFLPFVQQMPQLTTFSDPTQRNLGIVRFQERILLIAARPIINSQGQGLIRGTVIFGRYLDQQLLDTLAATTLFPFRLEDAVKPPSDLRSSIQQLNATNPRLISPIDEHALRGLQQIDDLQAKPALIVNIVRPRTIYNHGQHALQFVLILTAAVTTVGGLILYFLLNRVVISRVLKLSSEIKHVANNLHERVTVVGNDEVAGLAASINQTLAVLEQSQQATTAAETERNQFQATILASQAKQLALQDQLIQAQDVVIAEQATPLIPFSDDMLVMPLVGAIDQARASQILRSLLQGIEQQRARIALVDITGVAQIDGFTAEMLLKAANAVRLLGAQLVLTGLSPEIAQSLVAFGQQLDQLTTFSTLQAGIAWSIRR